MLRELLKNYVQFSGSSQRLRENFTIPGSYLAFHALDLPSSVISRHLHKRVSLIHLINKNLETNKIKLDLPDFPIFKTSLANCIDKYRASVELNPDSDIISTLKQNLEMKRITDDDAYARLAHLVLDGEIPKRNFRLQLKGVQLPLSVCCDKKIHVLNVLCKSLSHNALLLELNLKQRQMLKNAKFAQIHLSPASLFVTKSNHVHKEIPSLQKIEDYYRYRLNKERICSFEIDLNKLSFSSCHISYLESDNSLSPNVLVHVPFDSLIDSCLLQHATEVKSYFNNKISEIQNDICELLAS